MSFSTYTPHSVTKQTVSDKEVVIGFLSTHKDLKAQQANASIPGFHGFAQQLLQTGFKAQGDLKATAGQEGWFHYVQTFAKA